MRNVVRIVSHVFPGLRFRLLLLVVLACAPLVILTIHRAGEERRRAVANWSQRSERMLEQANREEEKLVGETRQLLLSMAESEAIRSGNRQRIKNQVRALFDSYPKYANLGVLNTNGDVVASATTEGARLSPAAQEFFKRTLETGSFTVSDLATEPLSGKPVVNVGYPVIDAEGRPAGAVFAALDLSWYNRFGSELPGQLPRWATWTEVDRNGTILLRYPSPKNWIGKTFPDRALLKTMMEQREGTAEGRDPNGAIMVYAFTSMRGQLGSGDSIAILGTPRQMLFAAADHALFVNLAWMGLAAMLAVIIGWVGSDLLIVRPVQTLVQSSTRLASGDLSARTGLPHTRDELGRLTLAFDLMAQSLQQREIERNRASHKLQVLSQRLVEVQETERRHIARELHDEIGQSLTVAEMNLQAALDSPGGQSSLNRRLKDSIQAVERVLEQVHDLSLNLRPSMLDDLGLEAALRWYTNRQATLTKLKSKFTGVALERRLDPVIETECFRVAQEALTNVVRHSNATAVAVELGRTDGQLHVRVRDDGVGFDVGSQREQAVRGASLGLLSMEERAALAGGGLEFKSAPGQGTEVHAWFPLKWRDEREGEQGNDESD